MAKIRCVVFDLAGTLVVDSGQVASCLLTATQSDLARDSIGRIGLDDIERFMGESKMDTIKKVFQPTFVAIENIFNGLMASKYMKKVELYDGVVETLEVLRNSKYEVVCNTGFPEVVAKVIIENSQLKDLITFVVTPDDVGGRGRPQADMLFYIKDRLYFPSTTWIAKVGDTNADVEEGRNARVGLNIWKDNGTRTKPAGDDYHTISKIEEIIPLLEKHNGKQ